MIRFIIVAGLILGSVAPAQAYFCSRPSEPYIPSGHYAERYQMESAGHDVEYYLDDMNDYIRCLQDEADDAQREAGNVLDDWNNEVDAFNRRQ